MLAWLFFGDLASGIFLGSAMRFQAWGKRSPRRTWATVMICNVLEGHLEHLFPMFFLTFSFKKGQRILS